MDDGAWVHLGPVNRIRAHADPNQYSSGYLNDFEVGDSFEVLYDAYYPSPLAQLLTADDGTTKSAPKKSPRLFGRCSSAGSGDSLFILVVLIVFTIWKRRRYG